MILSGIVIVLAGIVYLLSPLNTIQLPLSLIVGGSIVFMGITGLLVGYRLASYKYATTAISTEPPSLLNGLHQAAIDDSPYMMYIKDLDGSYVIINKKARDVFHLPKNQPITEQESFKGFQDKLSMYRHYDQLVVTNKQMYAFEDSFVLDGKTHYLYVLKYPILDDAGNVRYICGMSLDINELKETQLALKKAKEQADEARALQQQFLAYITHDIRTPMNGVLGLCDLLEHSELTEEQKLYVHYIGDAVNNLLTLVNEILDFSKIRYGQFHIDEIPFSIRDTLNKALYPLEAVANEKKIYLRYHIDDSVPVSIIGDAKRLQQIVLNLVGNALKFTAEGGVDVSVKTLGHHDDCVNIGIDIMDTGIGIAPEQLDAIFDVYRQSDKDTSRIYGGTGLGLAIVDQLVSLHGGSINVTSEPGKGTHFSLIIPYQQTNDV